jgi:hypothetical protein
MESAENTFAGTWQPFGLETDKGHLFALKIIFILYVNILLTLKLCKPEAN